MTDRVRLHVVHSLHRASLTAGYSLSVVRILASIRLRVTTGWGRPFDATVDTSAAVSLFPKWVWTNVVSKPVLRVQAMGVVARPECGVSATLAVVDVLLLDGHHRIGSLAIHAMLADSNEVPLLLGMQGCTDQLRLVCGVSNGSAYLETL